MQPWLGHKAVAHPHLSAAFKDTWLLCFCTQHCLSLQQSLHKETALQAQARLRAGLHCLPCPHGAPFRGWQRAPPACLPSAPPRRRSSSMAAPAVPRASSPTIQRTAQSAWVSRARDIGRGREACPAPPSTCGLHSVSGCHATHHTVLPALCCCTGQRLHRRQPCPAAQACRRMCPTPSRRWPGATPCWPWSPTTQRASAGAPPSRAAT